MADRITHDDINDYGCNSIDREYEWENLSTIAQQLYMIGHLLVDIRDELTRTPDVIVADEAAPGEESP